MFCRVEKVISLTTELIRMSTVVSGLCHDVSHTARTNLFMINSRSKLATRYHD
jgi:cAMP-specific phosphodiesterase 4